MGLTKNQGLQSRSKVHPFVDGVSDVLRLQNGTRKRDAREIHVELPERTLCGVPVASSQEFACMTQDLAVNLELTQTGPKD